MGKEINTWMNYEKHHIFSQITEEAELRKYNPNQIFHTWGIFYAIIKEAIFKRLSSKNMLL